jgi:hypothetical protein
MEILRRHTVYSPDNNVEQVQPATPQRIAYPPAEVYDPRVHYSSEPPAYRQPPVIDYRSLGNNYRNPVITGILMDVL